MPDVFDHRPLASRDGYQEAAGDVTAAIGSTSAPDLMSSVSAMTKASAMLIAMALRSASDDEVVKACGAQGAQLQSEVLALREAMRKEALAPTLPEGA